MQEIHSINNLVSLTLFKVTADFDLLLSNILCIYPLSAWCSARQERTDNLQILATPPIGSLYTCTYSSKGDKTSHRTDALLTHLLHFTIG